MFNDSDFTVSFFKNLQNITKRFLFQKTRKLSGYIASFELLFNKEDAQVYEVKMVEPTQDFTRIVFSNRTLNSSDK